MGNIANYIKCVCGAAFISSAVYASDISAKLEKFIEFAKKKANMIYQENGSILYFSDMNINENSAYLYQLEISSKNIFNKLDIQSINQKGIQNLSYKPNEIVKKIEVDGCETNVSSTTAHKRLADLLEYYSKKD